MSYPYGGRSHYSVVIVGGGQAGLSLSHCLQQRGIDHLVIEKRSLVHSWRTQRWDSFCLVTPNWQCQLPGWGYLGSDPHGFMVKDQINDWLAGFVAHVKAPAIEGVTVERVSRVPGTGERDRDAIASWCRPTPASTPPTRWWWPRRLPPSDRAAPGREAAFHRRAVPLGAVPQPGATARGRGAGGGLRPVGRADRRRPAPGRAARSTWPPATRRAARASTAAARWSTGSPT
jgi:hypothetical protein